MHDSISNLNTRPRAPVAPSSEGINLNGRNRHHSEGLPTHINGGFADLIVLRHQVGESWTDFQWSWRQFNQLRMNLWLVPISHEFFKNREFRPQQLRGSDEISSLVGTTWQRCDFAVLEWTWTELCRRCSKNSVLMGVRITTYTEEGRLGFFKNRMESSSRWMWAEHSGQLQCGCWFLRFRFHSPPVRVGFEISGGVRAAQYSKVMPLAGTVQHKF